MFFSCPKVLHKQVIVTCPICFDQKTGKKESKKKKKTVCDHENKRTFKDCPPRQQGHYMFANVWFEVNFTCQSPIRFPINFPNVPLKSFTVCLP